MQKVKIGVIDDEKEYVTRLISYLQEYSKGRWDLCAFTNIQALECYLDKRALDILIGTDRSILDKHRRRLLTDCRKLFFCVSFRLILCVCAPA